jgi:hypothetical protein
MHDNAPTASRTPPEHVNRTTRHGADQYVLACNARRDADDITFSNLERLEQEIHRLRSEVKWKREHASTRTRRWVRSKLIIVACVFAGAAAITGWMFSPNGRLARVSFIEGSNSGQEPAAIWTTKHFATSDMTQHEIDSLVARLRSLDARVVQ